MFRLLLLGALAFAIAATFVVPTVDASTVKKLDLEGLVDHAELVVEARVLAAEAGLDERGHIVTRYSFSVARTFRGAHRAHFAMNVPGGVLADGRGLLVPGMPVLAVGEESVLFLSSENRVGVRVPVGLSQGRLRVTRAANGAKRLVREHGELEFVDGAGQAVPAPPSTETFDYAATVARIEAACVVRAARERVGAGKKR